MTASAISWVLLTMGDRDEELKRAVASIEAQDVSGDIVVVANGGAVAQLPPSVQLTSLDQNVGIPGGRDVGVAATSAPIIGFLDDDAELLDVGAASRVLDVFESDQSVGAITMRIVDEHGATARRHVPRIGEAGPDRSGDVVNFLGGASIVRRDAYERAGGYWPDLHYAHEELDLSWRLHDLGYTVRYLADVRVAHPATPISRHPDGWWYTGRNRVMVARRNLPWVVAVPHVVAWLVVGWFRAPAGACRSSYGRGWWAGWKEPVPRCPMRWRTVWRLTKLGRPPIV